MNRYPVTNPDRVPEELLSISPISPGEQETVFSKGRTCIMRCVCVPVRYIPGRESTDRLQSEKDHPYQGNGHNADERRDKNSF